MCEVTTISKAFENKASIHGNTMSLGSTKHGLNRVMKMLRTDHSYIKRLLDGLREKLLQKDAEKLDDLNVIFRSLRLHADYVIEVQHPIEEILYKTLQDRRPILMSTIDKLLMEHAISESWLIAMRDLYSDDGLSSQRDRKHFVTLGLNYCNQKIAYIDKISRSVLSTIEVIFDAEDWVKVESHVDQILSEVGDLTNFLHQVRG